MVTIAIIGSSGSYGKMVMFTGDIINKMIQKIIDYVNSENIDWQDVQLLSGGSSGADHVAVLLHLQYRCKIKLFLPCEFANSKFYDNEKYEYKYNPGKLLNTLHREFGNVIYRNTLFDLDQTISPENTEIHKGMHERNKALAKSLTEDGILIAFTDSNTDIPSTSGTLQTWNLFKSNKKIHICINNL